MATRRREFRGDPDSLLAKRRITSYAGMCRRCGERFTSPNKATTHADGDHVVEEVRRYEVKVEE